MAKKLPRQISAKKIRFIRNNKEWLKYWRYFRKNIGAFWPMSIMLIGIILGVFITLFYASVHVPEWTLHELGIQDRIGLSAPSLSNQGNIVLKEERANVFEKLGPVGDFFGGVINPILTFFSIFLLLLSIKTQREELKETRKEMKAATLQAERAARAAEGGLIINRDSIRPFISVKEVSVVHREFFDDEGADINQSIILSGFNVGNSFARIFKVDLYLSTGAVTFTEEGQDLYECQEVFIKNYKPVRSGEDFEIYLDISDESLFEYDEIEYLRRYYDRTKRKLIKHGSVLDSIGELESDEFESIYIKWIVEVQYEDIFSQKWSTSVTLLTRGGYSDYDGEIVNVSDRKLSSGQPL